VTTTRQASTSTTGSTSVTSTEPTSHELRPSTKPQSSSKTTITESNKSSSTAPLETTSENILTTDSFTNLLTTTTSNSLIAVLISCDFGSSQTACESQLSLITQNSPNSIFIYTDSYRIDNSETIINGNGEFILASGPVSGEIYEVAADYSLSLEIGIYELKFNVAMFCNGFDCKQVDDAVNLNAMFKTNLKSNIKLLETINSQNIGEFGKWVENTVSLEIASDQEKDFSVI
jgi:hypothetical protein